MVKCLLKTMCMYLDKEEIMGKADERALNLIERSGMIRYKEQVANINAKV